MSDEEALNKFLKMMKRVNIQTMFILDPETELVTAQIIRISCGDKVIDSEPEPLDVPLRLATGDDLEETIN